MNFFKGNKFILYIKAFWDVCRKGYLFFLIVWLGFVISVPYLYFTVDFDENIELNYDIKGMYHRYDDDSDIQYFINVLDKNNKISSIDISKTEYDQLCGLDKYTQIAPSSKSINSTTYIVIYIIICCIIEFMYLGHVSDSNNEWFLYDF